jgi:hypothetical protein
MTSEPETTFLLRRAEEEAILAIRTEPTPAAETHRELSLRYSAKALEALTTVRSAFRIGSDGSD